MFSLFFLDVDLLLLVKTLPGRVFPYPVHPGPFTMTSENITEADVIASVCTILFDNFNMSSQQPLMTEHEEPNVSCSVITFHL